MPVFARVRDGVLVLTVDGDYTANELRRVGVGALEAEQTPRRVPVLLDLSGAAGVLNKPAAEHAATGAIFGAYKDRLTGIAIVAAPQVARLFDGASDFTSEAGVPVGAYQSHADARQWLLQST